MELSPQFLDLNPIENLWTDVKKVVHTGDPTSNEALWMVVKESWEWIPFTRCQDLVDCMPRRCAVVIANKGYNTIFDATPVYRVRPSYCFFSKLCSV